MSDDTLEMRDDPILRIISAMNQFYIGGLVGCWH